MNHEILRIKYTIDFVLCYILFCLRIILTKKDAKAARKRGARKDSLRPSRELCDLCVLYSEVLSFSGRPSAAFLSNLAFCRT